MKKLIILLLSIINYTNCMPQDKFKEFVNNFIMVELPIKNVENLSRNDTLNKKNTNDILIRGQEKKPQFINSNGTQMTIEQYYGLYPEEPFDYIKLDKNKNGELEEKILYFHPKAIPVGRISLNDSYISLIIKVIAFETTFYDLWNFTKEGEALSVICLFWGMRDAGPRNEEITYTIVDSRITKEGLIMWHENADGLETFRTYKLNKEGYFEIIEEEQKGEYEF